MGQRTINLLDDGAERNLQPASILQTGQILQPYGRIHFEPVPEAASEDLRRPDAFRRGHAFTIARETVDGPVSGRREFSS